MAIVPKDKQRDGRRKRLALSKKDKMIMTGRLRLGKVVMSVVVNLDHKKIKERLIY